MPSEPTKTDNTEPTNPVTLEQDWVDAIKTATEQYDTTSPDDPEAGTNPDSATDSATDSDLPKSTKGDGHTTSSPASNNKEEDAITDEPNPDKPNDAPPERNWANVLKVHEKNKLLREENTTLSNKIKELESQTQAINELQTVKENLEALQLDPVSWLQDNLGPQVLDAWNQRVSNGGKPTPNEQTLALENKVKLLEEKLQSQEQSITAKQQQEALKEYTDSVEKAIPNYPALAAIDKQEAITAIIEVAELHFENTQEVLSPEDAAQIVNAYLNEQTTQQTNIQTDTQSKPANNSSSTPGQSDTDASAKSPASSNKPNKTQSISNADQTNFNQTDLSNLSEEDLIREAEKLVDW